MNQLKHFHDTEDGRAILDAVRPLHATWGFGRPNVLLVDDYHSRDPSGYELLLSHVMASVGYVARYLGSEDSGSLTYLVYECVPLDFQI